MSGNKIKKMAEVHIYTQMVKDTKEVGWKIKNKEKVFIDIETVMCMMAIGRMIEGMDKEQWIITMGLRILELG